MRKGRKNALTTTLHRVVRTRAWDGLDRWEMARRLAEQLGASVDSQDGHSILEALAFAYSEGVLDERRTAEVAVQ